MRKVVLLFISLISLALSAQNVILRAGSEVYKYNKETRSWSKKPIPLNTTLNIGDSIRSYTAFTIEVPRTWSNFFSKRIFTYVKYPNGVRLSNRLTEAEDCYAIINTEVVEQGPHSLINHLKWILNNNEPYSFWGVGTELLNSNNLNPILCGEDISISTPLILSLFNKESYNLYVYILWKDVEWKAILGIDKCLRLSPFSYCEIPISLSEPLGNQTLLTICSKSLIDKSSIEYLLKDNTKAEYSDSISKSIGFEVLTFNLVK